MRHSRCLVALVCSLAVQSLSAGSPLKSFSDLDDTAPVDSSGLRKLATGWFSGASAAASALAKPIYDVLEVAVDNAARSPAELLALHSSTVAGARDLVRELLWGPVEAVAKLRPLGNTVYAPPRPQRRREQAVSPSASPAPAFSNYTLPRANMTCGGVGVLLPAPPTPGAAPVYSCNGAVVGPTAYAAITALQGPGGATAANVAALAAAVAAASGGGGGAPPLSAFVNADAPLPTNWSAGVPPATLAALGVTLGLPVANVTAARTAGDLLPASAVQGGPVPASLPFVLLALPPETVAALVNGTRCSVAAGEAAAAGSGSSGTCICPLDYTGVNCDLPRHYVCAVTVADPVYHACVSANGAGFEAPRAGAPGRLLAPAFGGLGAREYAYLGLAPQAGDGVSSDAAAAAAALFAAHDSVISNAGHPLGPGSGVAVPVSAADLASLPGRLGLAEDGDASRLPRADANLQQPPVTEYAAAASGDPQCMWLNVPHVRAAAAADPEAAAAAAAGAASGFTGAAYAAALAAAAPHLATGWPAGVVPLRLRVRCSFSAVPGSDRGLTAGRTVVDPLGVPYGPQHVAAAVAAGAGVGAAAAAAARLAADYSHPPIYADVAGSAAAWRCNGTVLTGSTAATALAARGYNASVPPPGRAPYFGGVLGCLEASFAYAAGGPQADPPFALSQAPLLPLALLVTPISSVALTPAPAALVPLPLHALAGGADVIAPLHVAAWEAPGGPLGLWAGGRLVLEARVVQAPQGAALGPQTREAGESPAQPSPLPPVPLSAALDAVMPGRREGEEGEAGGEWVRVPLLTGGPVARLTIDDAGWATPVRQPDGTALAVGVTLAVAGAAAAGAWWLQRRYDWWGACRRDLF